jgi:hypothetical protein
MKADCLIHRKRRFSDGSIIEIKIWLLPQASGERPHGLKYSLFYGNAEERIVGYDNESGKGDHRHYRDRQEPYRFSTMDCLISDFEQDVLKERGEG